MVNRRLAKSARSKQKKREKKSKKESLHNIKDENNDAAGQSRQSGGRRFRDMDSKHRAVQASKKGALGALRKKKSELLKRQAAERMVLKERLRELTEKKNRIKKGENAKVERRELNKYIRQLREQIVKKHSQGLKEVEQSIEKARENPSQRRRAGYLPSGIPSTLYRHQRQREVGSDWVDESSDSDDSSIPEEEMVQMFSHLTM